MKSKLFLPLIMLSIFLSSCLIKSFNPFYHKDDVIFKDELLGKWVDQDSATWEFLKPPISNSLKDNKELHPHYILNYLEEESTSRFMATLFKLDGAYYLDFFPDLEIIADHELLTLHTLPVHSLAKVEFDGKDGFNVYWYNEEWLGELIQNKQTDIDHQLIKYDEEEGTVVLSASTSDLQEFIRKFGNDPNAFDCDDQFSGDTFCRKLVRG